MDKLFLAIRKKLLNDVPELKLFDWDNGQYDGENKSLPLTPGVLMDVEQIEYSHAGGGFDPADIQITLKCGFRIRGRSDNNAPDNQDLTALEFLDILHRIGVAVDGLSSENTTGLQRESLNRIKVPGMKLYEYTFSAAYYETGNIKQTTTVPKPPLDVK